MEPKLIGKLYDKVAEWWYANHHTSRYGLPQIERAIRYCKSHRSALDVGCGSGGRIIHTLQQNEFNVYGIDISEKMIQIAQREHPDVIFEQADICTWLSNKKYNLIVAWDSIFHIPMDNQEIVVSKLCGLLEPDGILIYTFGDDYGDHESLSFSDELGKQYGKLDNDLFGYGTIGIDGNLRVLHDNNFKCLHLELDQYPQNHVYIIARKMN